MASTNIGAAERSDLTNAITDYSVDPMNIEGVGDQEETYYDNSNWSQYLGYYKKIPELKSAIDAIARWTLGKGFKADNRVSVILNGIMGFGEDTFNTILKNMIIVRQIGGDAFAEIIRNSKTGTIINIKPLDAGDMRIVVDRKGMIKRYEQLDKTRLRGSIKFDPKDILHLTKNRIADEIHGTSVIQSVEGIILMRNEAMNDWKRVLHRNVDPMMIFHLDTDDPAEISAFKAKVDAAKGKGDNMYIPKDAVVPENLSTAPQATLNPLSWIQYLNNFFYQAVGIPQIILGGSQEFTEATAKIAYLAFQQSVEDEQRDIEDQIWSQLGLRINLEFPASLENELLSDKTKDGAVNVQPNETTAGEGQ